MVPYSGDSWWFCWAACGYLSVSPMEQTQVLPSCQHVRASGSNEQGHYGNIFPGLQSRLSLSPPQWQLWLLVTAGGNYHWNRQHELWTGGKKSQLNNKHWNSVRLETMQWCFECHLHCKFSAVWCTQYISWSLDILNVGIMLCVNC